MYFNDSYEYEAIRDDLIQQSTDVIDEILGGRVSERQKDELLNSIVFLVEKSAKNFYNTTNPRNNSSRFPPNPTTPSINIILANPPANPFNYTPYQLPINSQTAQPPYLMNNVQQSQNQFPQFGQPFSMYGQLPIQTPQFGQPFQNYGQLPIQNKKSKSKSKKSQDSKHKKDKKDGKKGKEKDEFSTEVQTFDTPNPRAFSGIVNYFKSGSAGESLEVTCSSQENLGSFHSRDAISHGSGNIYFKSKNESNSWICLDFKNYRVSPTKYSIGTTNNGYKIKSWVIEGSNDNSQWDNLDTQQDNSLTKANNAVLIFNTKSNQKKKYKFIRIRLTGPNWANNYHMRLNSFEVYGTLYK